MEETYRHLLLLREEPVNPRRSRPAPRRVPPPEDLVAFGEQLRRSLHRAKEKAESALGGFDDRKLLKIDLSVPLEPEELERLSGERGIEIVSQETKKLVLAFASNKALEEFESRLSTLAGGGSPTYSQILFAIKGLDSWTEDDRKGWALSQEGWPKEESFVLDVELWPLSDRREREACVTAFEAWLNENKVTKVDAVKQPHLLLYRVRVNKENAPLLLRHRDVRLVDLPPRLGLDIRLLNTDLRQIEKVPAPPKNAPGIVVLDSGVATGHPLLAPAVGDAQSFVSGLGPEDENGHGTMVSGLALYGDMEDKIRRRVFTPAFWIYSGRILDKKNECDEKLIENQVDQAVRYFHREYGCRIFNLSFGDQRKPYLGGHVRGLAVTLDTLARELGVLFVVPTGNFLGSEEAPKDWRKEYPGYLLKPEASLIDPAPALNVLTVGSIARYDATFNAQRYQDDPAEQPIARRDQPSPFTRSGPSVGGAIKPELVAYGGNRAVNVRTTNQWLESRGLGEVSTCKDFAVGRLLTEGAGTSLAAPRIAHLAAQILSEYGNADHNLLRALLVAHAEWPQACVALLQKNDDLLRLCGYGKVREDTLVQSTEKEVTLYAMDKIQNRHHHFYEVPLPEEFLGGGRRCREVTVALAYSPSVRTTRVNYRACDMEFRLVRSASLDHVTKMFNAKTSKEEYKNIPEVSWARIGAKIRGKGTVQADTWIIKQPSQKMRDQRLFVVVTRIDQPWASGLTETEEPYALVVCLRDRENAEARLYTRIEARLRPRIQGRTTVR